MTKFSLICAVLSVLFFVSAVYAADIALNESCSLADAIKAANTDSPIGGCAAGGGADVITLSSDVTLDAVLPQITTEITIESTGYTIGGAARYSIFYVAEGAHLAIKDLIMIEGRAKYCRQPRNAELTITGCIDEDYVKVGGAIINLGELTITNSTFHGNSAEDGGAIINSGELTITNSTFRSNSAKYGGGISNYKGIVTITNSSFSNNSVAENGGAIFNTGKMNITNSTFRGNSAKDGIFGRGGALANAEGTVTITNSSFSNNSAEDGGAIEIWVFGKLTITDSSFSNNSAEDGGAISSGGSTKLTITDSSFSNNSATEDGGAIVNDEWSGLSITNSSFSDNAAYRDGAIGNRGELTLTSSSFTDNTAASNGGGISNYKGTVTLTNSSLSDNSADKGSGGGLFANAGIVTLSHVTIANNAAGHGGGIYIVGEEYAPLLNLHNSIIAYNIGGDCFAETIDENRGNLVEDGSCFADPSGDPMFDELVEPEDGSPAYYPLLEGSPAIDAASDDFCVETDQIDTARPQGGTCDIGAIEFVASSE